MPNNKYYVVPSSYDGVDAEALAKQFTDFSVGAGVIIYGAGQLGGMLLDWFEKNGIAVTCFCDADTDKQTRSHCGLPVISPQTLFAKYRGEAVIIAVFAHGDTIRATLEAGGIDPERIVTPPATAKKRFIQVPVETVTAAMAEKQGWETISQRCPLPRVADTTGPKVLLYTGVYNIAPHYLRRAIESVLRQTYRNFTYLVLDNGSTDGSAAIIREYAAKDARIDVVAFTVNSTTSRQQACAYTQVLLDKITDSYTYVCSLDSDDYYEADFLERTVALSEIHDAGITMAESLVYNAGNPAENWIMGSPIGTMVYDSLAEIIDMLCKYGIFHSVTWGKLYKRGIIVRYFQEYLSDEFFTELQGIGDVLGSWRNFIHSGKVVVTDKVLHYWTRRSSSTSFKLRADLPVVLRWLRMYCLAADMLRQIGSEEPRHWNAARQFLRMAFGEDVDLLVKAQYTDPENVCCRLKTVMRHPLLAELRNDTEFQGRIRLLDDMMAQLETENKP